MKLTGRSDRRYAGVALLSAALLLAACAGPESGPGGGSLGPPPVPTATTAGATPEAACVTDVDAVINREATPEMTEAPLPAELVTQLDEASRSSFEEAAAPGAIVGVRTPQGTWTQAYGLADPDADTPMEVGQHTRIGSVTKTFTGTAILRLAQEGRLSLSDPIEDYVSGVPNGDRITVRHLASMTSGVASYTADSAFTDRYFADPSLTISADELIAIGLAKSPLFEPGAQFDYSNTNTLLLGEVIESAARKPVDEALKELVLDPLELANTSWPGANTDLPEPYAHGFTLQGDTATPEDPADATHWNPSWAGAAGILISDMDDLLTYGRALGTGQGVLDAETQAERLGSIPGAAGYGLAIGCVDGWVGHTGELPGYNTSVFYDTRSDTTVVVQTNSDIASGDCPESPTLADDPQTAVCMAPATRMFVAISEALDHPFTPPAIQ